MPNYQTGHCDQTWGAHSAVAAIALFSPEIYCGDHGERSLGHKRYSPKTGAAPTG